MEKDEEIIFLLQNLSMAEMEIKALKKRLNNLDDYVRKIGCPN